MTELIIILGRIIFDLMLIGVGAYILYNYFSKKKKLRQSRMQQSSLLGLLKAVFIIKIKFQIVKVGKGVVPNKFVRECEEIARIHETIREKLLKKPRAQKT